MEVLKSTNIIQLREHSNSPLSLALFSDSKNINGLNKRTETSQSSNHECKPPACSLTRSLLVWGCGEFGQHGHNQNGDMTLESSLNKLNCGGLLSDGESPAVIACGSSHTLVLSENGNLYSWGNGTSGQLGNGTCQTINKPTPVLLKTSIQVQGMACGARHSFIWTVGGQCYSFGNNFNAQLGYNFSKADFKENQLQPVLVELFPQMRVKEVACGARHSLFLLTTGHVMAVGCNQLGQIGNDCTADAVIPTKLEDLNGISHIGCGNSHSLASDDTGRLYAWGYGKAFGSKARYIVSPQLFCPKQNGCCAVVSLAGGDSHSMALYENGVLYTWGNNYEGQLGLGKSTKYQSEPQPLPNNVLPRPVIHISCGETTCAAVAAKGKLYMWGKNAGVIHPEKPSQYFQFEPCNIEIEDKFVRQVSCGAWHVSAIVENSGKLDRNTAYQEIKTSTKNVQEEVHACTQPSENHFEDTGDGLVLNTSRHSNTQNELSICSDDSTSVWESGSSDCRRKEGLANKHNLLKTICDTSNYNLHWDEQMFDTDFEISNKNSCVEDREKVEMKIYNNDNVHSLGKFGKCLSASNSLKMPSYKLELPTEKFSKEESGQGISHKTDGQDSNKDCRTVNSKDSSQGFSENDMLQVRKSYGRDELIEVKGLSGIQMKATDISNLLTVGTTENKRVLKLSSPTASSKVIDTATSNTSFSRQQTMPVINLCFGTSENFTLSKQDKPKLGKPRFFSVWNMWNSSNLFHEKQSKRNLNTRQTKSESEIDSVLEGMLPNHPAHAVKEIQKWTKFKDDSKPEDRRTEKVPKHICHNHSGKLLPPICSCRRKNKSAKKEQIFNNVFIERW